MKQRLGKLLLKHFKELEEDYSDEQIIYALEDGNFLKDWCDKFDQLEIEFIHDFYTKKLNSKKA
jgi:hypothetical protein